MYQSAKKVEVLKGAAEVRERLNPSSSARPSNKSIRMPGIKLHSGRIREYSVLTRLPQRLKKEGTTESTSPTTTRRTVFDIKYGKAISAIPQRKGTNRRCFFP